MREVVLGDGSKYLVSDEVEGVEEEGADLDDGATPVLVTFKQSHGQVSGTLVSVAFTPSTLKLNVVGAEIECLPWSSFPLAVESILLGNYSVDLGSGRYLVKAKGNSRKCTMVFRASI